MTRREPADVRVMELFRAEREFKVWQYSVSHLMLLLSTVDYLADAPRVDVEFSLVPAMKLPTYLPSLRVRDPHLGELSVLGPEVESVCPGAFAAGLESNNGRLFVLEAENSVGWVLATGWMVAGEDPNRYANPLVERTDWPSDSVFVTPSYVGRYGQRGAHHRWWKPSGAQELSRILLHEWDPLGIRDAPEAASGYDAYLGQIGSRLSAGASAEDIAAFLCDVEEVRMGLAPSAATWGRNEALAARLIAWYASGIAAEES